MMKNIKCKHCGGTIVTGDDKCSHCGIPLPPDFAKDPRRKFVVYFIILVLFCGVMIIWLPPDWTRFIR